MNNDDNYIFYWVSTPKVTGGVEVYKYSTIIVNTPPIWKKFEGQPLNNLLNWLDKITNNNVTYKECRNL